MCIIGDLDIVFLFIFFILEGVSSVAYFYLWMFFTLNIFLSNDWRSGGKWSAGQMLLNE